jgi:hypothetical protein
MRMSVVIDCLGAHKFHCGDGFLSETQSRRQGSTVFWKLFEFVKISRRTLVHVRSISDGNSRALYRMTKHTPFSQEADSWKKWTSPKTTVCFVFLRGNLSSKPGNANKANQNGLSLVNWSDLPYQLKNSKRIGPKSAAHTDQSALKLSLKVFRAVPTLLSGITFITVICSLSSRWVSFSMGARDFHAVRQGFQSVRTKPKSSNSPCFQLRHAPND